jgi:thioredoxin reductase (NADPH)
LVSHVDKVILFHRGVGLTGQRSYQDRVIDSPKIEIRFATVVEEVLGEATVTGVRVQSLNGGAAENVELGGLFVYVGSAPHTDFLGGLVPLDHHGRIHTDPWMRTPVKGILAAGDVRSDSSAQAVAVAGDGATAAVAAHRYLNSGAWATTATSP